MIGKFESRIALRICGVQFFVRINNATYSTDLRLNATDIYRKDVQGNVIAILDNSGNVVVEYTYDAWGNHVVSGSNLTLGNLNPFRYRGYYYDTETGLYYLQTRYYDPETGRFINADDISYLDPETINGLNLYAYCRNNPIAYFKKINLHSAFSQNISFIAGSNSIGYGGHKKPNSPILEGGSSIGNGIRISANIVTMTHYKGSLIRDDFCNTFWGNISLITTVQNNKSEMIYSFSNIGNGGNSFGVGINMFDWLGGNIYVTDSIGVGASLQVTPYITMGVGLSANDGLSISVGYISNNTTVEGSVSIGWGTMAGLALAGIVAALPIPGGRVVGALIGGISLIFI